MEFLYPSFLFALAAVAVPVIIHLFNFRRFKKIYFPNVRLLKSIQQENQTRNKLRDVLILLARIFTIACLVLAFAGPFLPRSGRNVNMRDKLVGIYVDNSFSMEAGGAEGSFLDEARKKAADIARAYRPSDQFILLTNDFEGRHQRPFSRDELLSALQEIRLSPASRKITEVVARFRDLSQNAARPKSLYVVSDFRKSITDIHQLKKDSLLDLNLIPVKANALSNLYVDSCWFFSPVRQLGKTETLFVRIKNESEQTLENIPLKLFIDEKQKGLASFHVGPYGQTEVKLTFQQGDPGIHQGRLEIQDNPVVFDDRFYFSFSLYDRIPILVIHPGQENAYLKSLFEKDSLIQYNVVSENAVDYSRLSSMRMILLDGLKNISSGMSQELQKYVNGGGSLLVLPGALSELNSYRSFCGALKVPAYDRLDTANTRVSFLNLTHPIFQDVFEKIPENLELPVVNQYYRLTGGTAAYGDALMKMQNGMPFIYSQTVGKGKVYLSSVPLDPAFSNLPRQAIFVPVFYKMAVMSLPEEKPYFTLSKDDALDLSAVEMKGDRVFKIRSYGGNFSFVPEHRYMNSRYTILFHNQVKEAGGYLLESGEVPVCGLAFNYDRAESRMECVEADALRKILKDIGYDNATVMGDKNRSLTAMISEMNEGKRLWKYFVLAALLFLAAETALVRLWKTR